MHIGLLSNAPQAIWLPPIIMGGHFHNRPPTGIAKALQLTDRDYFAIHREIWISDDYRRCSEQMFVQIGRPKLSWANITTNSSNNCHCFPGFQLSALSFQHSIQESEVRSQNTIHMQGLSVMADGSLLMASSLLTPLDVMSWLRAIIVYGIELIGHLSPKLIATRIFMARVRA